jgi:2-amino-4-hydroxy-6-hydroxymethyldihydropteridine diphosphokinase
MARIFIALGSNIRPAENIKKAVRRVSEKMRINSISTVYCTEPEGRPEQPLYYNCVLEAESDSSPEEIKFHILRPIESQMGRARSDDKDAPRTIDLDLIAYDDLVLRSELLTLPDPLIAVRPFLAIPLAEIAPDFVVSDRNLPIKEIASTMATGRMKGLYEYTDILRMEISHGY